MTPYSTVISPNDHMWKTGEPWYFDVGLSALECINRALSTANVSPTSILDLPCGHGRVCRMLRMAFPDAHLSVSDLDADGVDFCAEHFRAEPIYSRADIRELTTSRTFDLIWCGSLFTHLDRGRWDDFLRFFAEHLRPGGVLVFTTHGRRPIQWMVEGFYGYGLTPQEQRRLIHGYATDGFGFASPANQAFGLSLSSTAFVCAAIERQRTLGLIGLHEAGWSAHQDVVSCVKLAKPYLDAASCAVSEEVAVVGGTRTPPRPDAPIGHIDEPLRDVTVVERPSRERLGGRPPRHPRGAGARGRTGSSRSRRSTGTGRTFQRPTPSSRTAPTATGGASTSNCRRPDLTRSQSRPSTSTASAPKSAPAGLRSRVPLVVQAVEPRVTIRSMTRSCRDGGSTISIFRTARQRARISTRVLRRFTRPGSKCCGGRSIRSWRGDGVNSAPSTSPATRATSRAIWRAEAAGACWRSMRARTTSRARA